jgi:hypothetical protein
MAHRTLEQFTAVNKPETRSQYQYHPQLQAPKVEQLIATQLGKKFAAFMEVGRFMTAFTKVCH